MILKDTVKLATTTKDGYGDDTVTIVTDVKALFIQRSGITHSENREAETGDATVYLDHKNQKLLDNMYHLEGMYIIAQNFGRGEAESWYRIIGVSVGQRKLLDNVVDNVYCTLQKVAGLPYDQR